MTRVSLILNGTRVDAEVDPNASLLDLLREELGHFGTKDACRQGECGSCSVLFDGELVCARPRHVVEGVRQLSIQLVCAQ
mgnify:CR=1 FL=1